MTTYLYQAFFSHVIDMNSQHHSVGGIQETTLTASLIKQFELTVYLVVRTSSTYFEERCDSEVC